MTDTDIHLSPREVQVLYGIACGDTIDCIALNLGISPRTVDYYSKSVMRKLEAPSKAAAVAKAMALNLIFVFVFNNEVIKDSYG